MAPRTTASRMNRAQAEARKVRAIAVRRDDRLRNVATAVVSGLGVIALLLLLTTP